MIVVNAMTATSFSIVFAIDCCANVWRRTHDLLTMMHLSRQRIISFKHMGNVLVEASQPVISYLFFFYLPKCVHRINTLQRVNMIGRGLLINWLLIRCFSTILTRSLFILISFPFEHLSGLFSSFRSVFFLGHCVRTPKFSNLYAFGIASQREK